MAVREILLKGIEHIGGSKTFFRLFFEKSTKKKRNIIVKINNRTDRHLLNKSF